MKYPDRFFLILVLSIVFELRVYPKVYITNQVSNIQYSTSNIQFNSYFVLRNSYLVIHKDTTKNHPGKKSAMLSSILPGLGQAYNKKYWKVPIIYALGATTIYYAVNNHYAYTHFRDAFICKSDSACSENESIPHSVKQLKVLKDQYRRDRDFFVILSVAVYVLNIIDASVDAHLLNFDVNDDLSLSIQPGIYQNYYNGISIGLCLKLEIGN